MKLVCALILCIVCVVGAANDVARQRSSDAKHDNVRTAQGDVNEDKQEIQVWKRVLEDSMSMSMPDEPCKLEPEDRRNQLFAQISKVSSPVLLTTPGTPQNKAFNFILNTNSTFVVCPNDKECPEKATNRYLLALLYYSTGGDTWINCRAANAPTAGTCVANGGTFQGQPFSECFTNEAVRWLDPSRDECDWCGVSCENQFGFADVPDTNECLTTDIDLENINQTGVIPQEMGFAPALLTFVLEDGRIGGSLPTSLSLPENLKIIDLNFQKIFGPIPESWYNLRKLVQLDLNDNLLTGTISNKLGDLEDLSFLQLGNNRLRGTIPPSIAQLDQLFALGVEGNDLTGSFPRLGSSIMSEIFAQDNDFTGELAVLANLPGYNELQVVDVSINRFTGNIPTQLGQARNLQFLDVSRNDVTGSMPSQICALRPPGGVLTDLVADCGRRPQVSCTCCTFCFDN